ncbi:MAG: GHKL domain-containing protein, partial [Turicibacter sp.]|nr:GHKL domain-containing protein [Turicibacter sp.]
LLDNAIESCKNGEKKYIKLQLYTFNESYLTLKITNSCNKPPLTKKGKLISQKLKKDIHGYGVKNIERSVLQYSGMSMWEYDEVTKDFKFTVMIPYV